MSDDAGEFPSPVSAPRASSVTLPVRRGRGPRSSFIANLVVAVCLLAIVAMVTAYLLAGAP